MNRSPEQTLTGGAVAVIGGMVVLVALGDIYQDWFVRDVGVAVTLIENAVPLLLAAGVAVVGTTVTARPDWVRVDASAVTRWCIVGAAGTLLVTLWTYGFQYLRGDLRPYHVFAYMAIWGAALGLGVGVYDAKRRDRTRAIAEKRSELARRDRLHTAFRDATRELVAAETREEIERTVRDGLAEALPTVRRVRFDGVDATGHDAATAALEAGELVVSSGDAATVAAVPLSRDGTDYGAMSVAADPETRFGAAERRMLSELGEVVGYAIGATKSKRALTTDSAVELDIEIGREDCFFAEASARHGAAMALEGTVETDGTLKGVYSVEGGDPAAVRDLADEYDAVTDAELVDAGETEGLIEVAFSPTALPAVVADHGGVVREAVSEDGATSARVEVPEGTDLRGLLDAVRSAYADAGLVTQRNVARPVRTDRSARAAVDEALTERQRTALKTAYLSGYYDSPRRRTGQEIAASLGIAGPTFHEHLRLGQRKLVETYLDPETAEG